MGPRARRRQGEAAPCDRREAALASFQTQGIYLPLAGGKPARPAQASSGRAPAEGARPPRSSLSGRRTKGDFIVSTSSEHSRRARAGAKATALVAAAAIALPLLGGCSASSGSSSDTGASSDGGAAAEASADSGASGSGTESSASSSDSSSGAAGSSSSAAATPAFDFSQGLDDDGHWSGVTALDLVTLPDDYASIQVPRSQVEPTDEDVTSQVSYIMSSYATTSQVTDRPVADGDTVNIDYVGTIDGTEFDGGSTGGSGTTVTIGVTQYIDDFLEQLVGHTPGETFDVEVTFPEDYGVESLNGKDAVFSVTINYIQETSTPDLTDEWVSQNLQATYGWTTVAEMRQSISDSLQATNLQQYVTDYVTQNSTATEIPESIVSYQEGLLVYQYESYAASFGMDLESMLQMAAGVSTTDELIASRREAIDETAKSYLVFQAVAEAQGMTVSDDDVTDYVFNATGSAEMSAFEDEYGMPYLRLLALMQKVGDFLTGNAVLVDSAAE